MPGMNPKEIRVAGTGRVLVAPIGTLAPTDTGTGWDEKWVDLGYTSPEGVKFARTEKTTQVDTWQSVGAARYIYSERDLTLKFGLLQINEDTMPFFFGGGAVGETAVGSGIFRYDIAADPVDDERALGVEFTDGANIVYRFVIPRGQVTDTDDMELSRKGAVKLGVTFSALALDNDTPLATWIMNDPAYLTA